MCKLTNWLIRLDEPISPSAVRHEKDRGWGYQGGEREYLGVEISRRGDLC